MEPTRFAFGRQNFFGADRSPRHIGGDRSSAMGVELASYHRDEIQRAVYALADQTGVASLAELMVTCQPHKGRVQTVCRKWPRPAWWHRAGTRGFQVILFN